MTKMSRPEKQALKKIRDHAQAILNEIDGLDQASKEPPLAPGTLVVPALSDEAKKGIAVPGGLQVVWGEPEETVRDIADFQTIVDGLQPGDSLTVPPGVYYGQLVVDGKPGCTIKADPGTVRLSGLWPDADLGKVAWREKWGAWVAPHGDSFMGSHDGHFLFRYKTVDDLKAAKIDHVTKPGYGYAYRKDEVFVKLAGDQNPNGQSIKLADKPKQTLITVKNSPNLTIEGLAIEGSGDADAIVYDAKSERPVLRNCVFEYCRRAARLSHGALVEWCEYTYPGFRKFFDDLYDLNDGDGTTIFHLVKNYWSAKGNAAIEGGFAESIHLDGSSKCEFRYNLYHQTFDGERLGAFTNSQSHHNVYQYNYDNHVEKENWQAKRPTRNLHLHHSLLLDCIAGPISHQDSTKRGMKGPHRVERCIVRSTDKERYHPPFLIKLLNLNSLEEPIVYERNYLEQAPGYNKGFGKANTICFALQKQAVDPNKIKLRGNIILDDELTKAKGEPDYSKDNIVTTDKPPVAALTELIGEDVSGEWPRPARRAFMPEAPVL